MTRDRLLGSLSLVTLATLLALALNQWRGLPLHPLGPFDPEPLAYLEPHINPDQARAQVGRATFMDVRDADSYRAGHIPGALLQSRNRMVTSQVAYDQPIIVYCSGGCGAALHVVASMRSHGYTQAVFMKGGFEAWCAAGGAQKRGDEP